jgi:tripartite-type tricarboxylate transporter receptor subunit TctC
MSIGRRTLLTSGVAASLAASLAAGRTAGADTFPSRPLRFIVPYAAGGNVDVTVRLVAEAMSHTLGQPVIVDNRPGAGGLVGMQATLGAPADGYTVVSGGYSPLYVSAIMAGEKPLVSAFQPISIMSTVPMVIVVPTNSPFADWKALLAKARANPGAVSLGHAGIGTPNHIAILRLQVEDKVKFAVVAYRGSGVGLNDVMAGQIDGYVDQLTSSLPYIKSGKLRALMVVSAERLAELPDVPSLKDLGEPVFDGGTTIGALVRVETPKPITAKLNEAIVAALNTKPVRDRLTELGALVRPSTPEEFAASIRADVDAVMELEKTGLLKE